MSWDRVPVDLSNLRVSSTEIRGQARSISYREAVWEALATALKEDKRVFIYGEGVDDPGGAWNDPCLHKEFGPGRSLIRLSAKIIDGIRHWGSVGWPEADLVHMRTDFSSSLWISWSTMRRNGNICLGAGRAFLW